MLIQLYGKDKHVKSHSLVIKKRIPNNQKDLLLKKLSKFFIYTSTSTAIDIIFVLSSYHESALPSWCCLKKKWSYFKFLDIKNIYCRLTIDRWEGRKLALHMETLSLVLSTKNDPRHDQKWFLSTKPEVIPEHCQMWLPNIH